MPHEDLCLPQGPHRAESPHFFYIHTPLCIQKDCASPGGRVKRRASPDKEERGLTEP